MSGGVAEWLKASDCKSDLFGVRWFESIPLHHTLVCFIFLGHNSGAVDIVLYKSKAFWASGSIKARRSAVAGGN